jgi:GTPase SAR1 family protein
MSEYDFTFKVMMFTNSSELAASLIKSRCIDIFRSNQKMTIGVEFLSKTITILDSRIKLQVWEVEGGERFQFIIPNYCCGTQAAIILCDILNPNPFDSVGVYAEMLRQRARDIPIFLVSSVVNSSPNQMRFREEGIRIVEEYHLSGFIEITSLLDPNIEFVFENLATCLLERFSQGQNVPRAYTRDQAQAPPHHLSFKKDSFVPQKEYKINAFLTLKFEYNTTNIYVGGRLFNQCKYLLFNIPIDKIKTYDRIESIDEAAEKLNRNMEINHNLIPPETEFWGHCSNLQAWYENNYDTRILHRNLAFPLLKALAQLGDNQARRVFKEEIAKRMESGYPTVIYYLIEQGYVQILNNEELDCILENPTFIENLKKWYFDYKHIPSWLSKKIESKYLS